MRLFPVNVRNSVNIQNLNLGLGYDIIVSWCDVSDSALSPTARVRLTYI